MAYPATRRRSLKILQAEDSAENRTLVRKILEAVGHHVIDAPDGKQALQLAEELHPDLILMDLYMPGMDGYTATAMIKALPELANVPVVALTASVLNGDRERCIRAGCDGYIKKPLDVLAFPDQIWEYFTGKRDTMAEVSEPIANWGGRASGDSPPPTRDEPSRLPIEMLVGWLDSVELEAATAFGYEEGHGRRTARVARLIGERLGFDDGELECLDRGCRLHDIGKIEAERRYPTEGEYLTSEAWTAFAAHPSDGATLLSKVSGLGEELGIVRHHHERWDGKGYPDGLSGDAIPRLAQICGVAEAFDSMVMRSNYRPQPLTVDEAVAEIKRCSGAQFSPAVVEAFLTLAEEGRLTVDAGQG